ncbi:MULTISPECIES: c-type cytochrome [Grimontia]|uniref:Cytochrome c6 n=1 Tax=Grimontia marina TaxID=646534 RepID=A0A128F9Y9_9GAMM|nr:MULTISPECIES: cytochrome c [Grimontia]WRV96539.1 cytochrome c [Grimontia sp. NTOU-MAR1]CZF83330.1 Cytochrome c6 [Grimontia marina]
MNRPFTSNALGQCLAVIGLVLMLLLSNEAIAVAVPITQESPLNIPTSPAEIKQGEIRFYQNCAYCHGAKGIGGKSKKLQCRDFEGDYLFDTISNGLRRGSQFMPPWADTFSESERLELVAYILSLRTLETCL